MSGVLDRVRVVLVRPKIAGNIGAVARAIANMGLSDLVLVAPQADPRDRRARQRAASAEPVLMTARTVDDLGEALAGVHWTLGASRREGRYRRAVEFAPRDMASMAVERLEAGQHLAIMFGPEDNGLDRTELLACDAVVRIPSHDDYPSLNLANAVMVCAYELFLAATGSAPPPAVGPAADQRADGEMIVRMVEKLRQGLVDIEYVRPEHPEHLLSAIRAMLGRAELTVTEARIVMGLAQQMQEFARYGSQRQ